MKYLVVVVACLLASCATHALPKPRTVVVLGNKTTPSVCECPDTVAANARAAKWKAYAEKLETQLGMPHEAQQ